MRAEHFLHMMVILIGAVSAWALLRSKWPGWTGFPLLLLVIQIVNDLGVAPLVFDLSGYSYRSESLYGRAYGPHALAAASLILVCYLMIASGLISIRLLSPRSIKSQPLRLRQPYSGSVMLRAWRVSVLFVITGLAANVFILCLLLRERSILAITYEKALMTDETLVESPAYSILLLIGQLLLIGALGMVFFCDKRRWRVHVGTLAFLLAVGVVALHGRRQGIITAIICFLLLHREAVGAIRLGRAAFYLLLSIFILGGVAHARGYNLMSANDSRSIDIFRFLRATAVGYCRIDDTAWVMKTVPHTIPYTGALNAVGTVGRFVPSLQIPRTNTLYSHVVQHFYGGVNPASGIGGANYSTAAELYAWGGWLSVVLFGYLIGLFFGSLFEWQRRNCNNPFLTFLAMLVSVQVFFFGVQARMPNIMHHVGVYVLAVAVMAALSIPSRRFAPFLLLFWWNLFPIFFWKLFDLDPLRILVLGSVPLLYFWAVQSLRITGAYFTRGTSFNGALRWISSSTPVSIIDSEATVAPNGL